MFEKLQKTWGDYGVWGHLIMIAVGTIPAGIDVLYLRHQPDYGLMGIVSAFCLFAPLILPSKAHGGKELGHVFWLTYGTSCMFGILWGYLICGMFVAPITFGLILALFLATRISIAYWMVGQMSRGFLAASATNFGSYPTWTRKVLHCCDCLQLQDEFRFIIEHLGRMDPDHVLEKWGGISREILSQSRNENHRQMLQRMLERAKAEIENWQVEVDSPVSIVRSIENPIVVTTQPK